MYRGVNLTLHYSICALNEQPDTCSNERS